MKVTLKDGSFKEYDQAMSVYDIAKDISEGLARVATAGEVDGEIVDLRTVVVAEGKIKKISTNPSFLEGIILIMKSMVLRKFALMINCLLKFQEIGNGAT